MADVPTSAIRGLAFFPGGDGLWKGASDVSQPPLAARPVVLLGQDFGRVSDFVEAHQRGEEDRNVTTWRGVLSVVRRARVPEGDCFFTNAIMGLRTTPKNTGASPGFRHVPFRNRCVEFLRLQLELLKPRAVVTLGWVPLEMLAGVLPDLVASVKAPSFSKMDEYGRQWYPKVPLPHVGTVAVAALMHPTAYKHHVATRRFRGKAGEDAQAELLRAAAASLP